MAALCLQDAIDPSLKSRPTLLSHRLVHQVKVLLPLANQIEHTQNVNHGIIIEGDVIMIPSLKGINLRPSSVGILRIENVTQPTLNTL
jgi:hypothetical protein